MSKKKSSPQVVRSIGISLGGAKSFRTNVVIFEFYPSQDQVFLKQLYCNIRDEKEISSDNQVLEIINNEKKVEAVVFDVPLSLPKALRCGVNCPGYDVCDCTEVAWIRSYYEERNKKMRPKKNFTPYTQRSCDIYLSTELGEKFNIPDALGSNLAPLTARAMYLKNMTSLPCEETFARASLWRLGRNLKINKSHLRFYKHAVMGDESRGAILKSIENSKMVFIYEQDRKMLIDNPGCFEAFICGLVGYLKYQRQLQKRPKGFPGRSVWPLLPSEVLPL